MQFGSYDVNLLEIGRFRMDGGALFGIVPRKLWLRAYPHVDEENRVELATYALLIRGKDSVLVVDAGLGEKLDGKTRSIFEVQQPENAMAEVLQRHGLSPQDVTHFVYTHLHFDHAGGSTVRDAAGEVVPLFPNAQHFIQAEHLAWARNPTDKDRASFSPENWEPVIDSGKMVQLNGNCEILPGIEVRTVHGHTPGLQMIVVHGETPPGDVPALSGLLFAVDLFPTAAHLPPHYVAAFDNHPIVSLDEKRQAMREAESRRLGMIFGHDPFIPGAVLVPSTRGYQVDRVLFTP